MTNRPRKRVLRYRKCPSCVMGNKRHQVFLIGRRQPKSAPQYTILRPTRGNTPSLWEEAGFRNQKTVGLGHKPTKDSQHDAQTWPESVHFVNHDQKGGASGNPYRTQDWGHLAFCFHSPCPQHPRDQRDTFLSLKYEIFPFSRPTPHQKEYFFNIPTTAGGRVINHGGRPEY